MTFNVGKRCDKSGNGSAKSLQFDSSNDVRLTSFPISDGNVDKFVQPPRANDVRLTSFPISDGNVVKLEQFHRPNDARLTCRKFPKTI